MLRVQRVQGRGNQLAQRLEGSLNAQRKPQFAGESTVTQVCKSCRGGATSTDALAGEGQPTQLPWQRRGNQHNCPGQCLQGSCMHSTTTSVQGSTHAAQ